MYFAFLLSSSCSEAIRIEVSGIALTDNDLLLILWYGSWRDLAQKDKTGNCCKQGLFCPTHFMKSSWSPFCKFPNFRSLKAKIPVFVIFLKKLQDPSELCFYFCYPKEKTIFSFNFSWKINTDQISFLSSKQANILVLAILVKLVKLTSTFSRAWKVGLKHGKEADNNECGFLIKWSLCLKAYKSLWSLLQFKNQ